MFFSIFRFRESLLREHYGTCWRQRWGAVSQRQIFDSAQQFCKLGKAAGDEVEMSPWGVTLHPLCAPTSVLSGPNSKYHSNFYVV